MENKSYFSQAFGAVSRNFLFVGLFTVVFYVLCFGLLFLVLKIAGNIIGDNINDVFSWIFAEQDSIIKLIFMALGKTLLIMAAVLTVWQILIAPVMVAYQGGILRLVRDGNVPFIMEYVRNYTPKCIVVMVTMYLKIALWSLLFWIPGVYKWLAYGLTPYVLADGSNKGQAVGAIKMSSKLMKGNKIKLFAIRIVAYGIPLVIHAMFRGTESETMVYTIGAVLFLLCAFIIGPYMYAAESAIYLSAMDKFNKTNAPAVDTPINK